MKKNIYLLLLLAAPVLYTACSDEWMAYKEEQYEHYISFKAPLNDDGVTEIYIRYRADSSTIYQLPVLVSGTTTNQQNLAIKVAVDPDTLENLNYAQFQSRTDLYYELLKNSFFTMPETVNINAGEDVGLLDIDFSLKGIDLAHKWILPLTIVPDTINYTYTPHPRKNYKKALLRVMPFNDYSGTYSSTNLMIYIKGGENGSPIVKSTMRVYVVDDHTVFFYAGMVDEDRTDRYNYKVYAEFNEETKEVSLYSDNPEMNFQSYSVPTFTVEEEMDATLPYLLRRTTVITGINYSFSDYSTSAGIIYEFTVQGSITMERQINTQIPDEDQAIEW